MPPWAEEVQALLLALPPDAVALMRGQSQLRPMLLAAYQAWGCTAALAAAEDGQTPAMSHLFLL